jgi:hypothetical protein
MFCIGCGSTLPNEAQFCPRCGKRTVLDQPASPPSLSEALPETETVVDDNENLHPSEKGERPEPGAEPQTRIGVDVPTPAPSPEAPESDNSPIPVSAVPATPAPRNLKRYVNAGSITLVIFGLTCMILGAVQGFIPIFLIEGLAFGGLAWLCAVRWPVSEGVRAVVLVASLLLAVLVGVTLDQDSFGPRYRYLSQGSVQYRVDERAGRTDRLAAGGWDPAAYDSEAKEIDILAAVFTVTLTKGYWEPALSGGNICFSLANSSGYILDRIAIEVKTQKKNLAEAGKDGSAVLDQQLILKSYGGGLISPGRNSLVCASSPRDLSADESWSYDLKGFYGWKQ